MNGLMQERREAEGRGMDGCMRLWDSQGAEREADQIGVQFARSQDVMGDMEKAYGADFSHVRIHHDADADARVRSVGRDAVAQGNHIFFGRGIFESPEPEAKALVGHELAHTMQQGEAGAQASAAVTRSAAPGAAQGGLMSWFKGLFGGSRKKKSKASAAAPAPVESSVPAADSAPAASPVPASGSAPVESSVPEESSMSAADSAPAGVSDLPDAPEMSQMLPDFDDEILPPAQYPSLTASSMDAPEKTVPDFADEILPPAQYPFLSISPEKVSGSKFDPLSGIDLPMRTPSREETSFSEMPASEHPFLSISSENVPTTQMGRQSLLSGGGKIDLAPIETPQPSAYQGPILRASEVRAPQRPNLMLRRLRLPKWN